MITKLARITPASLIMRSIAFVAAWASLWLAAPEILSDPRYVLLMAFVALGPAIGPNTRLVTATMLLIIVGWVVSALFAGEEATGLRTFALAAGLYLLHASCALAAVLPYDAIVDRAVLLRWAARTALVLLAGAVVSWIIILTAPTLTPSSSLPILLGGLAAAAALLAVLAYAARARKTARSPGL
jgi:hypothetical protein